MRPRRPWKRASSRAAASRCSGASKVLDGLKLGGDQQIGVNIVKRAIEEPMRWIASNAGQEGSIVVQKVRDMKDDEGFNALTDTYENLVKAGVIDPAKVVRSALQNASSIASLLLTTEALICDIPEQKKDAAMPGAGGMGGMDQRAPAHRGRTVSMKQQRPGRTVPSSGSLGILRYIHITWARLRAVVPLSTVPSDPPAADETTNRVEYLGEARRGGWPQWSMAVVLKACFEKWP